MVHFGDVMPLDRGCCFAFRRYLNLQGRKKQVADLAKKQNGGHRSENMYRVTNEKQEFLA